MSRCHRKYVRNRLTNPRKKKPKKAANLAGLKLQLPKRQPMKALTHLGKSPKVT